MSQHPIGEKSPTNPEELQAWLAELPRGTGLADCGAPEIVFLWQVFDRFDGRSIDCAGSPSRLRLDNQEHMHTASLWAPYTVAWLPPNVAEHPTTPTRSTEQTGA
jgi:hypothetical protein